jgi:hypothetical protein
MFNLPPDSLPPSPASVDPTLQEDINPLELPERHLEELGVASSEKPITLSCQSLEHHGLWDTNDCCSLCHSYEQLEPEPLRHKHVTVRGCCAAHEALNHLKSPPDDFLARLFGT